MSSSLLSPALFFLSGPHRALERVFGDNRTLMLTRSSFPGVGKYSGHWLGDNAANWNDIKWAIPGMLEFGLFGVPYVSSSTHSANTDTITGHYCWHAITIVIYTRMDWNDSGLYCAQHGASPVCLEVGLLLLETSPLSSYRSSSSNPRRIPTRTGVHTRP